MILTTNINADVARANLFEPIIIAEDDENSHTLIVQMQVDGENLQMALVNGTAKIGLNYKRADGTVGFASGMFVNGKISVALPNAMFELDDVVVCELIYAYSKQVTTHALSVHDGEIVVEGSTETTQCPLKSALFYIDSQLRVITEYEGGEI